MLKLYNLEGIAAYPLTNIAKFYIDSEFSGNKKLSFDISPKDENYKYIVEETRIEYDNLIYVVKKINERREVSSIECELSLDDFLKDAYFEYEAVEQTVAETIEPLILSLGWILLGAAAVSTNRTVRLENCNKLDIINEVAKQHNIAFNFDNKSKIITVVKYDVMQPTGVYFTDELNLQELSFKGNSANFATKLICRGKQNEDGSYLTFASINSGKDYVENYEYSTKVVTKLWVDDRFTDAQTLKDTAIEKLKLMAIPQRAYECKIIDLAKINTDYANLTFGLYDIVTLVDRVRGNKINHRIVAYRVYPLEPTENTIKLSSLSSTLKTTIETVETIVNNAGTIEVDGVTINEIKRDGRTNSLRIQETYTKGETASLIASGITQSAEAIRFDVSNLTTGLINDMGTVKTNQANMEVTADGLQVSIDKINTDGVGTLNNTTVKIDIAGITVGKTGNEFKTTMSNTGTYMYSYDKQIASYDKDGATTYNLTVQNEAILGNLRIMGYTISGEKRTHIHWIG